MSRCICEGNWRQIIKESEPFMDRLFLDKEGESYRLIGVLHSNDDYYYCMMSMTGKLQRLSCVSDIEGFGFELDDTRNGNGGGE